MDEQNPVQVKQVLVRSLIRQLSEVLDRKSHILSLPNSTQPTTCSNKRDASHDIPQERSDPGISVMDVMQSLSSEEQSVFVTLHYLLPFTFIPALDLLDKGAVEFIEPGFSGSLTEEKDDFGPVGMYRVKSSLDDYDPPYERVRTGTWTCSCVQFFKYAVKISEVMDELEAFSHDPGAPPGESEESAGEIEDEWFLKVGECAHVVACYIAMRCGDKVKKFVKRMRARSLDEWLEMCGIANVPRPTHPTPI
ncbi:hypothetical protein POJ06DRAFT_249230 [Lipomyces tetrasporus]|uniref:SWIM-type domain-containing protein n=1 Tax=Lipomyces tetrasporus TaxID=54092 RepID=A0AAD7VUR5_9ASCO|nr:uncharacterized protein POJ06DRAFT_249230 [Lipomyces tetrasporus]KAJ8102266.1 hypothetical protein POJ06DRAFT_249230 [Lipomyces tetrasporus]